ncbi:MAG: hypothetical protein H5U04_13295 [Firmicutes bacterium]|nr:hypothetical protein [Bacillota bacterium]
MRIRGFEFNMRELAGSMGDFGTLFPLAVGYIVYCGMNPAGFLVMMGLRRIIDAILWDYEPDFNPPGYFSVRGRIGGGQQNTRTPLCGCAAARPAPPSLPTRP